MKFFNLFKIVFKIYIFFSKFSIKCCIFICIYYFIINEKRHILKKESMQIPKLL